MTVLDPPGESAGAPRQQALAHKLWSLIHPRARGFSAASAARVAHSLSATPFSDTKALAHRLREALAKERVRLKHTPALQIASLLQFDTPWYRVADHSPTHTLLWLMSGLEEQYVFGHDELADRVVSCCDAWYRETSARLFRVHLDAEALTVEAGLPVGSNPRRPLYPILIARPSYIHPDWFVQGCRILERLRRRLEEAGTAIVDGVAALQLYRLLQLERTDGVRLLNPELVLTLRNEGGADVLVARGSEMTCWSKLESNTEGLDYSIELDDNAWRLGRQRYVWELMSASITGSVVGRLTHPLGPHEVRGLLRRYRIAKTILSGPSYFVMRPNRFIDCTGETVCRVNLPALLHLIHASGLSWGTCCLHIGREVDQSSPLPMDFLLRSLEKLSFDDPNAVLDPQLGLRPLREPGDAPPSAHFTAVDHVTLRLARSCRGSLRKALKGAADIINDAFVAEASHLSDASQHRANPERSGQWRAQSLGNTLDALEDSLGRRGFAVYRGLLPRFVHVHTDTSNAVPVRTYVLAQSVFLDIRPERSRDRRARLRKRHRDAARSSVDAG